MKNKQQIIKVTFGGVLVIVSLLTFIKPYFDDNYETSVFSWYEEQVINFDDTFRTLSTLKVSTIYQFISYNPDVELIDDFLESATKYEKNVYFLTGEPEWALDPEATELKAYIETINMFKKKHTSLKGIVIDVEPQSLDEYQESPAEVMSLFVQAMKTAYTAAHKVGLVVVLCLPNSLDTLGFEKDLDILIRDASDSVAIMNYHRGQEIERIETEAILSAKYNKPIINIYELQPAGTFDLTEENTYFNHGVTAVYENYKYMKNVFDTQEIFLSLHEFQHLRMLTEK